MAIVELGKHQLPMKCLRLATTSHAEDHTLFECISKKLLGHNRRGYDHLYVVPNWVSGLKGVLIVVYNNIHTNSIQYNNIIHNNNNNSIQVRSIIIIMIMILILLLLLLLIIIMIIIIIIMIIIIIIIIIILSNMVKSSDVPVIATATVMVDTTTYRSSCSHGYGYGNISE